MGLSLALVAVFILTAYEYLASFEAVIERYGLIPAEWGREGGLTLFTSFFLHAGWIHLLGNLYFFWIAAFDSEGRLGSFRFLALIALATLAGTVAHILWEPRSMVPTVGASGGISGVLAYWALCFPKKRLNFYVPMWGSRSLAWGTVGWNASIPVPFALALWLALQGWLAWLQVYEMSSVSGFAHLGGALVGVLAFLGGWSLRRRQLNDPDWEFAD